MTVTAVPAYCMSCCGLGTGDYFFKTHDTGYKTILIIAGCYTCPYAARYSGIVSFGSSGIVT